MDAERLNQALYDKMAAEQDALRADLLGKKPEEILDHTYEYAMREDILVEMETLDLSADQSAALLASPTPLADVYEKWSNAEARYMEDIRDVIEELADTRVKDRKASRSIPLYRHSGEYAKAHGELDAFRASYQANVACKEAIEAAIRAGFDGSHLTADPKGVLAEFGPERVTYVLAATIQSKGWDERFSRVNKAWATVVPMYDDEDRCRPYIIHIHSTVVDGFVSLVRKELDVMREQSVKKSSIKEWLAAAPVSGESSKRKTHSVDVR
mgnify:CR=1 FL=1